MKKLMIVMFIFALTLTLSACGQKETETSNDTVTYKDGTYFAEGEKRQYGYETATVTIVDGEITEVVLERMTADGNIIDYDAAEFDGSHSEKPNLKQARLDLANSIIQNQSTDLDAISGATQSSNEWLNAVDACLSEATE